MENLSEVQTNIQEQQPVSPSPKNWRRVGFLVTTALFLATAGVFSFYVLKTERGTKLPQPTRPAPTPTLTPVPTPSPTLPVISPTPTLDPTADWKTYTNTKYGYQFKHPPEWSFRITLTNEETAPLYVFREGASSGNIDDYSILIRAYDNPDELSLVDWLQYKRDSNSLTLPTKDIELVPNFMVAGVLAFKIWNDPISKGKEPGKCFQACPILDVYFTYKNKAYGAQLNYTREVDEGSQETFLRLLSTFKFLG